jgi:hypothetical protein
MRYLCRSGEVPGRLTIDPGCVKTRALLRLRDFITILGSAAAWPVGALPQQPDLTKRLGVLMGYALATSTGIR